MDILRSVIKAHDTQRLRTFLGNPLGASFVRATDEKGQTLLHYAALEGDLDVCFLFSSLHSFFLVSYPLPLFPLFFFFFFFKLNRPLVCWFTMEQRSLQEIGEVSVALRSQGLLCGITDLSLPSFFFYLFIGVLPCMSAAWYGHFSAAHYLLRIGSLFYLPSLLLPFSQVSFR